jgi:hypothetical protein
MVYIAAHGTLDMGSNEQSIGKSDEDRYVNVIIAKKCCLYSFGNATGKNAGIKCFIHL